MGENSIRKQIERDGHSPDWTCDVIRRHRDYGFEISQHTIDQFEELEFVLRHPEYMDKSKVQEVFYRMMSSSVAIDFLSDKLNVIIDHLGIAAPPKSEKAEPIVRRPGPCGYPDGEAMLKGAECVRRDAQLADTAFEAGWPGDVRCM